MKKEEPVSLFKEILKCLFDITWRLAVSFLFIFGFLLFASYRATGEVSLETMKYLGMSFAIIIPVILLFFFMFSLALRLLGGLRR